MADHEFDVNGSATVRLKTAGTYVEEDILVRVEAEKGDPGFSPTVSVEEIDGGNRVTITDAEGAKAFDVMNGFGSAGTPFRKKEEEVFCYPIDGTELHVISHLKPVYGVDTKNLLPVSYWNDNWNGIFYTWDEDLGLAIEGTATGGNSTYALSPVGKKFKLEKGIYTFSVGSILPEGVYIAFDAYEDAPNYAGYSSEYSFALRSDDSITFKASGMHEYEIILFVANGTTADCTIYPQVEAGEYATGYAPYTDTPGEPQPTRSMTLSLAAGEENKQYSVDFDRDVFNGEYNWNSGILTDLNSGAEYAYNPAEIKAMAGLNVITPSTGLIDVEGYTDDSHSEKMQEYIHISRLYMYGDTAAMSKDNTVTMRFRYIGAEDYINDNLESGIRESGKRRGGWVRVKWQGSSSVAFPKKNYTLAFYQDEYGGKKRSIPFRDKWGAQSKYNAKANFIDPTQCRNVVAAKLWGECVRSRNPDSESYIRMHALPNAGAVDGYPMLVFINDKYQGIYTMNIPKSDWMFGMEDGVGENTVLCGERYNSSTEFYGPPAVDGTDWDYEVEPADKSWVQASFAAIYAAISMPESSETEKDAKKAALEKCVDIYSVMDYDIFLETLGLTDNTGKNQLMATYDGARWIMSAYDMDTAFGNHWSGAKYWPADKNYDLGNGLTWAVRLLYPDKYAARKAELKNGCLSASNILDKLLNFGIDIPQEAYRAEAEIWPDMCGANANAMQQIVAFILRRGGQTDLDGVVSDVLAALPVYNGEVEDA